MSSIEARNIDLAFKPVLDKVIELDKKLKDLDHPPPPTTKEDKKSKLWK